MIKNHLKFFLGCYKENAVVVAATFKMQMQQVTKRIEKEQFQAICGAEVIYEEESDEEEEEI